MCNIRAIRARLQLYLHFHHVKALCKEGKMNAMNTHYIFIIAIVSFVTKDMPGYL